MGLLRYLQEADQVLERIALSMEVVMAQAHAFRDLLDAINQETDRLAAKIQALMDKVSSSGLSGAEETEILGELTEVRDRLSSIGADPENPVP